MEASHCLSGCERVENGNALVEWMATGFQSCVYDGEPWAMAAFWVGMSSLGFWIMCQLPQFIENFQRKSASALSHWFILEWFSGDVTNLIGAFLTNQASTQKFTAGLFVVMDCCMLSQMYYYTKIMQAPVRDTPGKVVDLLRSSFSGTTPQDAPDAKSDAKLETPMERATIGGDYRQVSGSTAVGVGTDSQSRSGLGASCGTAVLGLVLITLCASSTVMAPSSATGFTAARRLLDNSCASTPAKAVKITGTALGWTSAAIYLNSRLPQVYKNYKAKTVEGLSWLMFFCAVMGNLTYALGVLLKVEGWSDVNDALPWLVGSLGTIVFDVIIVVQCFIYGDATNKEKFDAALKSNDKLRDSLLAPSPSPTFGPEAGSRFRSQSFLQAMLNRDGSTPVYLDSGTQRLFMPSGTQPVQPSGIFSSSVP